MKNEKVIRAMKQIVKEHPEVLQHFRSDLKYDLRAAQRLKPGQVAVWMLRDTGSDWVRLGSPAFLEWIRAMAKANQLAYFVTTEGIRQTTMEEALQRAEAYAECVPVYEFQLGTRAMQVRADAQEDAQEYFLGWTAWCWGRPLPEIQDMWAKEGRARRVS